MKYTTLNSGQFFLRFELGEEMVSGIQGFVEEKGLTSGYVSAIGGLSKAELGAYFLKDREYRFKEISGDLELVSLTGNIADSDDGIMIHMHCVIGDGDLQTVGGHLKSATVAGTVEVLITPFDKPFKRTYNDEVGLKLLDFDE